MKRLLSTIGILALIALGFGLAAVFMRLNTGPIILQQDSVVSGITADSYSVTLNTAAGGFIDIQPTGNSNSLLILYPGGLVRPQAYEWLGVALSAHGMRTIIPVMPLDLAITAAERASTVLDSLAEQPERVYIAGHSLGGAMAARYALRHPERLDGLILMAAYSADSDDLSSLPLEVLVLHAENDGLATTDKVLAGLPRLPASSRYTVIPGAVHSFFGRYGPQAGDGVPTISRTEAETQIISTMLDFIQHQQ